MFTLLVAGDGVFSMEENERIVLVDLKTNTTRSLISTTDIKDVAKFSFESFAAYLLTFPCRKTETLLFGPVGSPLLI